MAESNSTAAAGAEKKSSAFRNYEDWFTQSPDPWAEIAALQPGDDRTFASTVQRMVTNAEPEQRAVLETKLLALLARPGITATGRMFACRMLSWVGADRSVPVLAKVLLEPHGADAARYALESIPGDAAAQALLAGLDHLTGVAKAGLIGALALRGTAAAAPRFERIATDTLETPEVRAAAARGLARLHAKFASL